MVKNQLVDTSRKGLTATEKRKAGDGCKKGKEKKRTVR